MTQMEEAAQPESVEPTPPGDDVPSSPVAVPPMHDIEAAVVAAVEATESSVETVEPSTHRKSPGGNVSCRVR